MGRDRKGFKGRRAPPQRKERGLRASFQDSTDAMLYANECANTLGKTYEVWASDHFEHGTEERLYLTITPDSVKA